MAENRQDYFVRYRCGNCGASREYKFAYGQGAPTLMLCSNCGVREAHKTV